MSDVVKYQGGLSTDTFRFTRIGVKITTDPTYEEWYGALKQVAAYDGAIQWWIGDLAAADGRVINGVKSDAYDQLEKETGLVYGTIKNCKMVAQAVDLSYRNDRLSFTHHMAVAPLQPEDQKRWLQKAVDEGLTVAQLRRAIKAEAYQEPSLPDSKYRIIYADPPWEYSGDQHGTTTGTTAHAIGSQDTVLSTHYPSMTEEQLCEMSVQDITADNCALWMWATVPLLPVALRVIEAWGFQYKCHMVWDKVDHNVGHYVSVRHELLLISGHGSSTPDVAELVDSVYSEKRAGHSQKPVYFRDLIDNLYPSPSSCIDRVELFTRDKLPDHWDSMGNEVGKHE